MPTDASVESEFFLLLGEGAAEDGAQAHADGKQAGGLAVDEVEVLVEGDEAAEFFHLQQLAFDHHLGEVDEGVEDAEIALLDGDLEGLHVEPVAGEDALGVAPLGVGGGAAAAGLGFVDDVVVDQGGGVDDFDHRAELDGAALAVAKQPGGEQEQDGTNALAAAGAQIFADIGDDADVGDSVAAELALDGGEIVAEEVENFTRVGGERWTSRISLRQLGSVVGELHVDAKIRIHATRR